MEQPNYVLKTNESVLMPENPSKLDHWIKIGVLAVVGVIIVASLLFQENIFMELSLLTRILLIGLVIKVLFFGKKVETPSPMELQFYDDRLVFYLPKRYYSPRTSRKQINTFKYADITKVLYKKKYDRFHIYGDGTSVWYNYDKNGNLPDKPTEDRTFTDGMVYFSALAAPEVDFVKEIEEHSPLKVTIEE